MEYSFNIDDYINDPLIQQSVLFIIQMCKQLSLQQLTTSASLCFYHKCAIDYYDESIDHILLAKAAVFLAGKCEETPRNLKDIVNVSHEIMNPHTYPLPFDSIYFSERSDILLYEQILLRDINFELSIQHPHPYLLKFIQILKGEKKEAEKCLSILNDSYRLPLCVLHSSIALACGCIQVGYEALENKSLESTAASIRKLTSSSDPNSVISQAHNLASSSNSSSSKELEPCWADIFGVGKSELDIIVKYIKLLLYSGKYTSKKYDPELHKHLTEQFLVTRKKSDEEKNKKVKES